MRQGKHRKKALIFMADGMDTTNLSSLAQTLAVSQRTGVLIYTVGTGARTIATRRVAADSPSAHSALSLGAS